MLPLCHRGPFHQQRMQWTLVGNLDHKHGSNSVTGVRAINVEPPTIHSDQPRDTVLINDNYCVPQWACVKSAKRTETFVDNCQTLNVNSFAVNHVTFVPR